MASVSYAHKDSPHGHRYLQDDTDPLPAWAVGVKPYVAPEDPVTPEVAIERVLSGCWDQAEFLTWFKKQEQETKDAAWSDGLAEGRGDNDCY